MLFKIKITLLFFLSFLQNSAQKDSSQFVNYYIQKNEAVYDFEMKGEYDSAYKHFQLALEQNNKPYFRDLITLLEVSILLKKSRNEISGYIESLFKTGVPLTELKYSGFIYEYLEANSNLDVIKEEKQLLNKFYGGIEYDLYSKLCYFKAQDELLRPYWRDSIARKIMGEVYLNNLTNLKKVSNTYGFPGLNKIGYLYNDVDVLFIHGFQTLKNDAEFLRWERTLRKELFLFNILPSHYASYIDNYNSRNYGEQIYGTSYSIKNEIRTFDPQIKSPLNVDSLRVTIGLMPLWQHAEILGVELPNGYSK